MASAEAALSAARQANSPIEAWEAAALMIRWVGRLVCVGGCGPVAID